MAASPFTPFTRMLLSIRGLGIGHKSWSVRIGPLVVLSGHRSVYRQQSVRQMTVTVVAIVGCVGLASSPGQKCGARNVSIETALQIEKDVRRTALESET